MEGSASGNKVRSDLDSISAVVVEIVRSAGKMVRDNFERPHAISSKAHERDYVTETDRLAENFIVEKLQEYFPDDAVVSEERPSLSGQSGVAWIVDPLDGTYNFVHRIPNCGVMIARATGSSLDLGVIYNPFKELLAVAIKGQGVALNGEIVRRREDSNVSPRIIAGKGRAKEACAAAGIPTHCFWSSVDNALAILRGEYNVYLNDKTAVWDLAPLALIFAEAGLAVSNLNGGDFYWNESRGLCASPVTLKRWVFESIDFRMVLG